MKDNLKRKENNKTSDNKKIKREKEKNIVIKDNKEKPKIEKIKNNSNKKGKIAYEIKEKKIINNITKERKKENIIIKKEKKKKISNNNRKVKDTKLAKSYDEVHYEESEENENDNELQYSFLNNGLNNNKTNSIREPSVELKSLRQSLEKYSIQRSDEPFQNEDASFKILFIGDPGVGKSSLVIQESEQKYIPFYKTTVGFDLINIIIKINSKILKLQFWDTCGQEEFSMCTQSLFNNASLAVIVYSIISRKSFDGVNKWLDHVKNLTNKEILIFLVGNKSDLEESREVGKEEGKRLMEKMGMNFFMETSAKTGEGVSDLFKEIGVKLYEGCFINGDGVSNDDIIDSMMEDYLLESPNISLLANRGLIKKKNKKCC